jgi:GT2 family glycosyltransferase
VSSTALAPTLAATPAVDLDRLDLAFLAWREAPRMLARLHAACSAALPAGWRGTALVVENAAPPVTSRAARELVSSSYPAAERVALRMPRNMGYARAMNLALAELQGEYVALLNSDGRPEPGMFERLVGALDAAPDALWAAPAVHGPGEDCQPPGPPYREERLAGTALVIRRRPFLALGGFDPLYWFYSEDYDASARVREAGRELLRVPDAVFHHGKGGRSRRGILIREFWYAATDQTLTCHRAPHRRDAARRMAGHRARSLADHVRDRDLPGTAGIAAASLLFPVSAALAERRRRRAWDGPQLEAWLARHRPRAERIALGPRAEAPPQGMFGAGSSLPRSSGGTGPSPT